MGLIMPIKPLVEGPADAVTRLESVDPGESGERRPPDLVSIARPQAPGVICNLGSETETRVQPVTRGVMLHWMGTRIVNLRHLGWPALQATADFVAPAPAHAVGPRRATEPHLAPVVWSPG